MVAIKFVLFYTLFLLVSLALGKNFKPKYNSHSSEIDKKEFRIEAAEFIAFESSEESKEKEKKKNSKTTKHIKNKKTTTSKQTKVTSIKNIQTTTSNPMETTTLNKSTNTTTSKVVSSSTDNITTTQPLSETKTTHSTARRSTSITETTTATTKMLLKALSLDFTTEASTKSKDETLKNNVDNENREKISSTISVLENLSKKLSTNGINKMTTNNFTSTKIRVTPTYTSRDNVDVSTAVPTKVSNNEYKKNTLTPGHQTKVTKSSSILTIDEGLTIPESIKNFKKEFRYSM
uniref:Uncharacterized protein n=1 Tax=Parastrongyloides trichosuri TaxID=131310 RepID=A0A0N5A0N9_PARTI